MIWSSWSCRKIKYPVRSFSNKYTGQSRERGVHFTYLDRSSCLESCPANTLHLQLPVWCRLVASSLCTSAVNNTHLYVAEPLVLSPGWAAWLKERSTIHSGCIRTEWCLLSRGKGDSTEDRFARFSIVFRLLEVEKARQRIHVDAFILEFSDGNRSWWKEIQSLGREERSEETRRRRRSRVGGGMGRREDGDDKLS